MSQAASTTPKQAPKLSKDIDVTKIKSTVLLRLIEEVRNDEPSTIRAFDRIHNRHNRSGGGSGGGW